MHGSVFLDIDLPCEADAYIRVLCSPLVYRGDNKWLAQHGRTVVEPVSAMLSRAVVHVGSDGFVHARP